MRPSYQSSISRSWQGFCAAAAVGASERTTRTAASGPTSDERLAWMGGASIAVALVGALVLPRRALGGAGAGLAAALVAWVAWSGVTIWWSIEPDRSWDV